MRQRHICSTIEYTFWFDLLRGSLKAPRIPSRLIMRSSKMRKPHTRAILAASQAYGFADWGQQHVAGAAEKLIFVFLAAKDFMTSEEQEMEL